jgi:hypothetical protein
VVTLGAVVNIPPDLFDFHTYQFLGQFDLFGQLNSDRDPLLLGQITIPHEVIPGVGHHLNPHVPGFMSVDKVLQKVPVSITDRVSHSEIAGDERSKRSWGDWLPIVARARSRRSSGCS